MFSGCIVLPDSKETKFGSSNQKASPSAGKNTRVVFVPRSHMEVHPYSFSSGVDISEVTGCHLLTTDELSVRVTKITSSIGG